ncbi:hypothetical protein C2E23DRAFT_799157 [Lenzites betulinus]|nr:hypothetical protein C2E23DRAFT_799157 [Lenzites betulinus]
MAAAEAIADAQALQLQGYILTSITALLLYNWIVTIDDEVNQFRRRKITGASILFVAFRYIPMANYIMVLPFYSFSHELVVFTKFLDVSQYFLWAAFAGMRTWALLRRLDVALLIGFFSVTPFLVNLISLHWGKVIPDDPTFGCDIVFIGIPESVNKIFAVLARLPPVLADLTVLGITWSTQYHPYRMSQSTGQPARLITIMLRNGSIYFT